LETFDRGAIQNRIKNLKDNDPRPFQRRKAEKLAETRGQKSDSDLTQEQRDLIKKQLAAGREVAMIMPKDQYRRARGRLGDKFEFDPLIEWTEIRYGAKDTDLNYTAWALYRIKSRTSKPRVWLTWNNRLTNWTPGCGMSERISTRAFRVGRRHGRRCRIRNTTCAICGTS